jgi:hypothetical protein
MRSFNGQFGNAPQQVRPPHPQGPDPRDLGPASRTPEMIRKLAEAGADAFRVNMSHGTHKDHAQLIEIIRTLEKELDRPTTILADLQGPKLRVGKFEGDGVDLERGQTFVFDRDHALGIRASGSSFRTARYSAGSRRVPGCCSTTASSSSGW